MICEVIIILFVLLTLYILKPLLPLLILKYKLGSKAKLYFYPIKGLFQFLQNSIKTDNDALFFLTSEVRKDNEIKIILTNIGMKPLIMFLDPSYYRELLMNHQNYGKHQAIAMPDNRLLAKGLLFTQGEKWKHQRSLFGTQFHFEDLKSRVPMINEVILDKIEEVKREHKDQIFRQLEVCSSIAAQVVLKSFFGEDLTNFKINGNAPHEQLISNLERIGNLLRRSLFFMAKYTFFKQKAWTLFPTKQETLIYNHTTTILKGIEQLVDKRLQLKEEQLKQGKQLDTTDFLDIYMNDFLSKENQTRKDKMTKDEMIQQSITLFGAGTDTTANLLANAVYYLGIDQEAQKEIREEVLSVLGDKKTIEHNDLNKLVKVKGILNECLRMRPVTLGIFSRVVMFDHYIKDVQLRKGWLVMPCWMGALQNGKYFENPEVFDYKRWLDKPFKENSENQNFIFVPFSAGGRNCIGQHFAMIEAIIMLSHFLRNFEFRPKQGAKAIWETKVVVGLAHDDLTYFDVRK